MAAKITQDTIDQIIELRLRGVSVREVATTVGVTTKTVVDRYKRWLAETSEERTAELELVREELIQKHRRAALDARRGVLRAQNEADYRMEATYLSEERNALKELAKLTGSDAPAKIEHSGETGFTVLRIVEETVEGAE